MKKSGYKILILIFGLLLLCLPLSACKRRKPESFVCSRTGHSFGVWTEKTPSTCTKAGVKTHTCSICNYEETEPLPLAEHSLKLSDESTFINCETGGVRVLVCNNCSYKKEETIAASEHSYGEWKEVSHLSCTTDKVIKRTCGICDYFQEEITPATGHSYSEWTIGKEPECTAGGYYKRTCCNCNGEEREPIPALGHSYDDDEYCTVCGYNPNVANLIFALNDDKASYKVTGYKNEMTDLVIPKIYKGLPVTEIRKYAFESCHTLKTVKIGGSVKSIGIRAFWDCNNLESITLPFVGEDINGLGSTEFGHIFGAKSVNQSELIPESLKTVTVTGGVIYENAFTYCNGIENIFIGSGVLAIDDGAFYACNNLKYNEYGNCLYLGNEENPYMLLVKAVDAQITDCTVHPNTNFLYGGAFNGCNALQYNEYKNGLYLGNYENPYMLLVKATTGLINSRTRFIYDYAFRDCNWLSEITIPSSVTSIGERAFTFIRGITDLTIPRSVIKLSTDFFRCYEDFVSITVEEGNKRYHSDGNCLIETASKTLILGCLTSVIPTDGSVTVIGKLAFSNYNGLTNIVIPDSITTIKYRAFLNCVDLTEIFIPKSVTNIEEAAFVGCSVTVYCEAASKPSGWDTRWVGGGVTIVWGASGD